MHFHRNDLNKCKKSMKEVFLTAITDAFSKKTLLTGPYYWVPSYIEVTNNASLKDFFSEMFSLHFFLL
jgi:hypothetical protein